MDGDLLVNTTEVAFFPGNYSTWFFIYGVYGVIYSLHHLSSSSSLYLSGVLVYSDGHKFVMVDVTMVFYRYIANCALRFQFTVE